MTEEFTNPGLVAIYDAANPYEPGTQPDFYLRLAKELNASVVLDLGCGTGIVACLLARHGFEVIGVDQSAAMLDVARARLDAGSVRWIHGDASTIGAPGPDLAIMTGHVAQFFWTDRSWSEALAALHGALAPGGRLAFEARNPAAEEWRAWGPEARSNSLMPSRGRSSSGSMSTTSTREWWSTQSTTISPGATRRSSPRASCDFARRQSWRRRLPRPVSSPSTCMEDGIAYQPGPRLRS
jgi:SAM-dependent methyltransferase